MSYQVLWIDDDKDLLSSVTLELDSICEVQCAHCIADGLRALRNLSIDLVLLDINIGAENGLEALQMIKEQDPNAHIVMVSGQKDSKLIVRAVRSGAADYICKPFEQEDVIALIEKMKAVSKIKDRHDTLVAEQNPLNQARQFVGISPSYRSMLAHADRLAGHNANVLIQGESGTGKELLARYIHSLERDAKRPFVTVNCAAIPEGLIESELFGHERGSFTGANTRKIGKFELANGGDIFLDEISSLRLDLQAKILRALQEKEVVRVGGSAPIKVNFRVLSATNESLENLVNMGDFRMDLFHRLRVIQVEAPALRDRQEDIPLLIAHFLEKYGRGESKRITADALKRLQEYSWPGNIRELENVIHSLVILNPDPVIDKHALPQWHATSAEPGTTHSAQLHIAGLPIEDNEALPGLKQFIRSAERNYIDRVLTMHEGDKSAAAGALHIGRTTLYAKLREHGLMQ